MLVAPFLDAQQGARAVLHSGERAGGRREADSHAPQVQVEIREQSLQAHWDIGSNDVVDFRVFNDREPFLYHRTSTIET